MHMASRWSSEFIVAEHRDLQATAMAVDCTGTYVLLAGRRYLGLKNLIELNDTLKKFPRQSKYDVGSAEWNPHSSSRDLCAISTNQKIEVLNWAQNGLATLHTLNAHTRVVSNLNWNPFDENLLASCSIDTFTYIWDLRDAKRPAVSLSNVAGATQVRWNKQSRHLLATAHNGDVKLWDQRKSTTPVQYITAHLANIHCLDWNPNHENQLATASQDCTVKFFDTANPKKVESVKLTSAAPVWRARYTPFGNGFLMVVVPPMRRGENSLLLWNLSNRSAPVHTFVGHTDIVLEFEWRKQPNSSDYQLITWSKDQTLRIWQIEPFLQKLCGIENANDVNIVPPPDSLLATAPLVSSVVESTLVVDGRNHSIDIANGLLDTSSTVMSMTTSVSSSGSTQPRTLYQEFSLVNVNLNNVTFDMIDPEKRKCSVTAAVSNNIVVVHIAFPPDYPHNVAPVFQFGSSTTVDSTLKNKLLKVLKQTAQQRVKRSRFCLEQCVRQLVSTLEEASHADEVDQSQYLQIQGALLHSSLYNFRDENVPFPRTSGAKFCNVGMLVCFGRVLGRNNGSRQDKPTPRSLSALNNFPQEAPPPVPAFYYQNRLGHRPRLGRTLSRLSQKGSKSCVIVYDASALFPMKKELAMKYIFNPDDVPSMCLYNAQVSAVTGRKDLAQIWSLAALAATPSVNDEDDSFPWDSHPLSVGLIQSLIDHYISEHDVQTAAMLCCAFGNKIQHQQATQFITRALSSSPEVPKESPYHTMHQVDSSIESLNLLHKRNPSSLNSWSECSLDDFTATPAVEMNDVVGFIEPDRCDNRVLLPESPVYERCKLAYAEVLHRWHLLEARAQVMKFVTKTVETHQGIEPAVECLNCRQKGKDATCVHCRVPTLLCVICHTSVKGGANACFICGHGGHTQHIYEWFSNNSVCPSGCGCQCLIESISSLEV